VAWDVYSAERFLDERETFQPLIALELTSTSRAIFTTELPADCTFVIGSERHGIPAALLSACDSAIHIPMYGTNGSMNVTHALGVALFEWRRQHGHYE
jgi:tRNA G18 (ribose-2'-O)-methylase SpoU